MAGFIYYIPGRSTPIPHADRIPEECELRGIFKDAAIEHGYTEHGPDGGPGTLFCVSGTQTPHCESDAKLRAEKQEWTEVKGEGGTTHWVGFDKASPPTPKDLARPKMLDGKIVKLGDDNQWLLPVIYAQFNSLRKAYRYVNGQITTVTLPGNEELVRDAEKWFDIIMQIRAGEDPLVSPWDMVQFAADVLAVNYRVGLVEITCGTNIITNDTEVFSGIMNAVYGLDYIREENEAQKKTATQPVG